MDRTQVVIVGSGFGALAAAKKLGKAGTPFVLISETTEHLFQPLLYQVATGVISPGEIAPSIRAILAKYPSGDVRLGRVVDVDPDKKEVVYEPAASATPSVTTASSPRRAPGRPTSGATSSPRSRTRSRPSPTPTGCAGRSSAASRRRTPPPTRSVVATCCTSS